MDFAAELKKWSDRSDTYELAVRKSLRVLEATECSMEAVDKIYDLLVTADKKVAPFRYNSRIKETPNE